MRRIVLVVCVVALAGVAHADLDPAKIEHARSEALTDEYQPSLPGSDGTEASGQPLQHQRERQIRYVDTRDLERDQASTGSTMLSYILWGGIIIGFGLLLFWLGAELLKYGGDDAAIAQDAAAPAAPDLAVIERPLGDAEDFASRGEYREAIHTLLLRTLQELARTASVRVLPAMTSREILGRVPLLADAREALANLITAVELTHFGGDDASEADYIRCRAQFQVFATAFRGRAA